MELNLPIYNRLSSCKNILIAGMGGGFDVFCGLPVYFELVKRGHKVHLANFSFSNISAFKDGVHLTKDLVGVTAEQKDLSAYFPEKYLAQWFKMEENTDITIWCFRITGAKPLLQNYKILTEHLSIDGILLIDGGVDSLIQGDETSTGSMLEDAYSLYAVNELNHIPVRLLGAVGFGAELSIAYNQIFENIACLSGSGAFLGACALTKEMESYQKYESAVLSVQKNPWQDPSVINSSIISAVRGEFGNYHLTEKTKGSVLWISPLMAIYWFFDLPAAAKHSKVVHLFEDTITFYDGLEVMMKYSVSNDRRNTPENIPL